ncbi:hypothetical protein MATL_G00229830 [Megalops atlanticus]|uniref:C-type lectin domain-containing protein n=1 Tax=Megalops atlanticus TaxID=7932 RepID=A0A9D3SW89_MEGAT|nr:hypothetical protein MATL_G00229830 [Megalops atlanticus]
MVSIVPVDKEFQNIYSGLAFPDNDVYNTLEQTTKSTKDAQKTGVSIENPRPSVPSCREAAVCLGLLSVLLLTAIIVLCVHYNRQLSQTDTSRLMDEVEQLRANHSALAAAYQGLQSENKNLTLTNHMLQADNDNLTTALGHLSKEKTEAEAERDILNQTYTMLLQYFPVESYCPVKNDTWEIMCGRCLPGWKLFESSCYYFSTERKNWMDSRTECRKLDADLLIIENLAEQRFISETIELYDELRWAPYWIGMTDAINETVWVWVDSTLTTTLFWASSDPNDNGNEDCATITKSQMHSTSWYDEECSKSFRWICEINALKRSTETMAADTHTQLRT